MGRAHGSEIYTEDELKQLLGKQISKRPWPTIGTVVTIAYDSWHRGGGQGGGSPTSVVFEAVRCWCQEKIIDGWAGCVMPGAKHVQLDLESVAA